MIMNQTIGLALPRLGGSRVRCLEFMSRVNMATQSVVRVRLPCTPQPHDSLVERHST